MMEKSSSLNNPAENLQINGGSSVSLTCCKQGEEKTCGIKRKLYIPSNYTQRNEYRKIQTALKSYNVIVLYGLGGVGKTTLLKKILSEKSCGVICEVKNKEAFSFTAKKILRECFGETELPADDQELINLIRERLENNADDNASAPIIIIDNLETIMDTGSNSGSFLPDYKSYKSFCESFLEATTNCKLILSGREKIELSNRYYECHIPIRMDGINVSQAKKLLSGKRFSLNGTDKDWADLVRYYSGNPLELKIAAAEIRERFSGNIQAFLSDPSIPHELNDLLGDQFNRFSKLEKTILYWCTIEREPVEEHYLTSRFTYVDSSKQVVKQAFKNISNHCFLDIANEDGARAYSLQPVIQEFISENLIDVFYCEFERKNLDYALFVPLIDTDSKDYVVRYQKELLSAPIVRRLENKFGASLSDHLKGICSIFGTQRNYAVGNILSLLSVMGPIIEDWDFANCYVLNADFRSIKIKNCDFSNAKFEHVLTLYTFGNLIDVKYSYDDSTIIGGATDYNLYLWDSSTLSFKHRLGGHNDWVRSVDSNSKYLASGSNDETVRVYEATSLSFIRIFREENRVRKVVLPRVADDFVYSSGDSGCINRWNILTGDRKIFEGHHGVVWNFALVSIDDTDYIISVSDDGTVIAWDLKSDTSTEILRTHDFTEEQCTFRSVVFDSDRKRLFIGTTNGTIVVYSWEEHKVLCILQCHKGIVWSLDYDPNRHLLVSSSDKHIIIWDCKTDCISPCNTLDAHECEIWNVYFSRDYSRIISTADDYCFRLWDTAKFRQLNSVRGYTNLLRCVYASDSIDSLFVAGDDSVIRRYDLSDTSQVSCFYSGHMNRVRHVDVSPNGKWMVSCSDDKSIILWNLLTGEKKRFWGHKKRVWSVCFIGDESFASAGEENDIYIWDIDKSTPVDYLKGHTDWIWDISFCQEKDLLASASEDKTCKIWDMRNRTPLHTFNDHQKWLFGVSFSMSGNHIVTASTDGTAKIYNIQKKEMVCSLQKSDCWVWSAIFITDDTVVTGGQDGSIRIFKVDFQKKTSALKYQSTTHQGWVDSLAVASKHNVFFSASADESVKMWNITDYSYKGDVYIDKPYDGMIIDNIDGLTKSEINSLKQLGAKEKTRRE